MLAVLTSSYIVGTSASAHWQNCTAAALVIVKRVAHESHPCYLAKRNLATDDTAYTQLFSAKMLKTAVHVALRVYYRLVCAAIHTRQLPARHTCHQHWVASVSYSSHTFLKQLAVSHAHARAVEACTILNIVTTYDDTPCLYFTRKLCLHIFVQVLIGCRICIVNTHLYCQTHVLSPRVLDMLNRDKIFMSFQMFALLVPLWVFRSGRATCCWKFRGVRK